MELLYKVFWFIIVLSLALLGWLFWDVKTAGAVAIFETGFDSLTPGDLDGQDGWTSPVSNTATVTSTEFFSSPYSAYLKSADMSKLGTKIYGVGEFSFRMLISSNGATTQEAQVGLSGNSALTHSDAPILVTCKDDNCDAWGAQLNGCFGSSYFTTVLGYVDLDTWHDYIIEFDSATDKYRVKIDDADFSIWGQCYSNAWTWMDSFWGVNYISQIEIYLDDMYEELPTAGIDITAPETETEQAQTFNITGDFDIMAEDWDRLMILFEEWDASTTCPEYESEDWWTEYDQGMFYYQSVPFFSDFFTSTTGEFSVTIDNLRTGNYNCIRCYFINETTGEFSDQLCQGYTLDITDIAPETPTFYLPFLPWTDYYETSSDTFSTSTVLFQNMADALGPLVERMGEFILYVRDYFDASEAMEKGRELGQAIPKARGYLVTIDNFINLPLSSFVIFYFLTLAVVISYKIILTVIKLFKP